MKTLEEFLECECGMVTPNLLKLFEPHREFVERQLAAFDHEHDDLTQFLEELWKYLPEPNSSHFTP